MIVETRSLSIAEDNKLAFEIAGDFLKSCFQNHHPDHPSPPSIRGPFFVYQLTKALLWQK